jgi:hypothetical protein
VGTGQVEVLSQRLNKQGVGCGGQCHLSVAMGNSRRAREA